MTVVEALVHVRIILLPLWLEVSLFLSGCPQTRHSLSSPEVVIPLRVTSTGRGERDSGWISYNLNFGGQRHTVHVKVKKLLVSRDLSVFTYTDQGSVVEDQPFFQNDCYYHGYVEGDPESMVSLSTCLGGFQGILRIHDIIYEIKPKIHSATFEHLVYKIDSEMAQSQHQRCRLSTEEVAEKLKVQENVESVLRQRTYDFRWTNLFYNEIFIVVDHGRYIYKHRNISSVNMEVLMVTNMVDSFYIAMGLHVLLISIEIWNEGNPFHSSSTSNMNTQFCQWKNTNYGDRLPHDAGHMFMREEKMCADDLSEAFQLGLCDMQRNCGLECFMDDSIYKIATMMAHEHGHLIGFQHDGPECQCGNPLCLMNERGEPANRFSNCTYEKFYELSRKLGCMSNAPKPESVIMMKHCGNSVVESGEDCDCGTQKSCAEDPCCFENCTLKQGAVCARGLCCSECQFMPPGTMCRAQENECDFPEWCNGTSWKCPDDVYVEDGSPCLGEGFCYEKRCNSHDEQCRKIFGEGAKSASPSCYLAMNTKGDSFGHCQVINNKYVRCSTSDSLCGRIQCENITQLPLLTDHHTVYAMSINNVVCWGIKYDYEMTKPDIGKVNDGTECALGRMCINGNCVPNLLVEDTCLPLFCNRRGICNNKHNCHCSDDWSPPNCLMKGFGGSIDSGPPPAEKRKLYEKKYQSRRRKINIIIMILPSLMFSLLLVLLVLFKHPLKRKEKDVQRAPKEKDKKVQTLPVQKNEDIEIPTPTKKLNS